MNDRMDAGAVRRLGVATLAAAALGSAVLADGAYADDSREKQLEDRVKGLEQELQQVREAVRGGYFTASSDLEARVGELERLVADDKGGMVSFFKTGMKSESTDGAHAFSMYGRIQNDWFWYDTDDDVEQALGEEINGGTEFRRVRLGAEGKMYGNVKFKSEIDFAGGAVEFADVMMEVTHLPFGTFRVGHFDEPFGLDRLTSSRFLTFLERNFIAEAFAPQRNTGVMIHGDAADKMLIYQVGMFRDADPAGDDVGNEDTGEYNFTGRVAVRPMVDAEKSTYLHLGAALSYRDYSNDEVRYRARPGFHAAPRFVDTGTFEGEDGILLGLEAAFVAGPLGVQAEYAIVDVDSAPADDPVFDSWSIEASYFLTGESKAYSTSKGSFDRPKVKKNYGSEDGIGAWQVGLRYDTIDLNDAGVSGGECDTITAGVNWYLNPNTRFSFNYVFADPDDLDGEVGAFVVRFQVDF